MLYENSMIKNELKHRTIYISGVISAMMLFLAYQVKTPFEIDLGEQGDEAYLRNFWDIETVDALSYRWSSDRSSILLPGIGGYAPALLHIRLNGSRPTGLSSPMVSIRANGRELTSFVATDEFETYELAIDRQTMGFSGDLHLEINSEFFVPDEVMGGGDLRKLGVLVDSLSVELERSVIPIVPPPARQFFYLAFAVMASFLLARQLGLSRGISSAVGGLLLLTLLLLVVRYRLLLGRYSAWLIGLLALVNIIVVLARLLRGLVTGERRLLDTGMADSNLIVAVIVILALGHYVRFGLLRHVREDRATDFFINYTAATVLAQGGNIYDASCLREASQLAEPPLVHFDFGSLCCTYITPPFHVLLLLPLVPLGYEKARIALLLLNNLLLFSSLALVLRARGGASLPLSHCLLAFLLVFTFEPIYVSLELGQVDFLILLLISMTFWAYRSRRDMIAGLCLGLAAMIKLSPALLIVYFLWKGEHRILIWAVVGAFMAGVLSWAIAGHGAVLFFSTSVFPALFKGTAFFQNQSLNGFFSRLFVDPGLYYSLEEFPSIPQARALSTLSSLALVGIGAFVTRERISRSSLRFDFEFSLAIVTMLLVSSICWEHYFTWVLLPFLVLLNPVLRSYLTTGECLSVIVAASFSYLVIVIPSSFYGMTLHSSSVSFPAEMALTLLISLRVYGALLLYSILAYLALTFPVRKSTESVGWTTEEVSL